MDNKIHELLKESLEMLHQAKDEISLKDDELSNILSGYIDDSIKLVNSDITFLKYMPRNEEIEIPTHITNRLT